MPKYKPGECGNPNGRPKGTGYRQTIFRQFVEPHVQEIIAKAIELAKEGNETMLRFILDRVLPAKPEDNHVSLSIDIKKLTNVTALCQVNTEALTAVVNSDITPLEGARLSSMVANQAKLLEIVELDKRIENLEKNI